MQRAASLRDEKKQYFKAIEDTDKKVNKNGKKRWERILNDAKQEDVQFYATLMQSLHSCIMPTHSYLVALLCLVN